MFLIAALLVGAFLVRAQMRQERSEPEPVLPSAYPFGADSVWRQDVSTAPVAADSDVMIDGLAAQVADHYGGVAAFNVNSYTASYYEVGPDTPRVDVAWDNCQDKDYTPKGLLGKGGQLSQIPVPADAVPAEGRDAQLTIYSPSTDQLWELWRAKQVGGEWGACWGGRIDGVSQSPGYFSGGFGASASGLAISGGMVWVDDARAGRIDHALSLAVLDVRHWKTVSWPAQRSDGGDKSEAAIPAGTRLRLDPRLDLNGLALTPMGRLIAQAAQKYGFIVTDKSGAVAVTAESGGVRASEDPWPKLLGGKKSYEVMAGFPWDRLQALPQDYGKPEEATAA
jgi:hypothetical protein